MPARRVNPYRVKLHRLYDVRELAECLGVHKNTVRHWQDDGLIDESVRSMPDADVDRAIVAGEATRLAVQTPLFSNLPEHAVQAVAKPKKLTPYKLNRELGIPQALWQEQPLDYRQFSDPVFLHDVSNAFCDASALVGKLGQSLIRPA